MSGKCTFYEKNTLGRMDLLASRLLQQRSTLVTYACFDVLLHLHIFFFSSLHLDFVVCVFFFTSLHFTFFFLYSRSRSYFSLFGVVAPFNISIFVYAINHFSVCGLYNIRILHTVSCLLKRKRVSKAKIFLFHFV